MRQTAFPARNWHPPLHPALRPSSSARRLPARRVCGNHQTPCPAERSVPKAPIVLQGAVSRHALSARPITCRRCKLVCRLSSVHSRAFLSSKRSGRMLRLHDRILCSQRGRCSLHSLSRRSLSTVACSPQQQRMCPLSERCASCPRRFQFHPAVHRSALRCRLLYHS